MTMMSLPLHKLLPCCVLAHRRMLEMYDLAIQQRMSVVLHTSVLLQIGYKKIQASLLMHIKVRHCIGVKL